MNEGQQIAQCDREIRDCLDYLKAGGADRQDELAYMGMQDWRSEQRLIKERMYLDFVSNKLAVSHDAGERLAERSVNSLLKPHQADIVRWAIQGKRRAIFAAFGLGKSFMQLECARLVCEATGGRFLIVCPLGVRQEFARDAAKLGITVTFIRSIDEAGSTGIYLTNYETVRDGKLDPKQFSGASLDEAAILRGFGGTKTFREFMRLFEGIEYKFVATATPSPNEYIELLAYSAFLEVMDVGEAKTRFFKRNSEKADQLTIHPHKEREFWLWCASWGIFLQRPSDLGYSDDGYDLPEIEVHWHEIPSNHADAGIETSGQHRLIKSAALGVVHAAREKRDSLTDRLGKLREIIHDNRTAGEQFIVWCDQNAEQNGVDRTLKNMGITSSSLYGADDVEDREQMLQAWRDCETEAFVSKPVMYGAGVNLQQCNWAIFAGIGFKFSEFIQAIKRIHRFLQTRRVRIDLIYTEAEREVRRILEEKWTAHNAMMARMSEIIREFGLARNAIADALKRSLGCDRAEASGDGWKLINNDCVLETIRMADNSVHLILTSMPFSTQYEYTPSYNDFGHTEDNAHFWRQMGFLIPELLRVLKPGRIAAIHVKDRIVPGGINKLGFQTVYPFHADAIMEFQRHGFAYLGMVTITTDVVRENNQTYRLGWSEQCKDATKMGVGMPEYLLLFRKAPSDTSNSYADDPVVKSKGNYSRSRWQIDAHAYHKSSGNRLLTADDLVPMTHAEIFQAFKRWTENGVYNYEHHVMLAESLERCPDCKHIHVGQKRCGTGECKCSKAGGRLPVTFMLLQPASWSEHVWSDVTRMLGMNTLQAARGKEGHLCPMQFDICDRTITRFTEPGETVFDPFMGLGSVAYRAIHLGRKVIGTELNGRYWADSVEYLRAAEQKINMPTLFDLVEEGAA